MPWQIRSNEGFGARLPSLDHSIKDVIMCETANDSVELAKEADPVSVAQSTWGREAMRGPPCPPAQGIGSRGGSA
jgi:hypothetical protein